VTDLLDRLAGLLLITCACGVGIKIPAAYTAVAIACPRCGRQHPVPHPEASPTASKDAAAPPADPLGPPLRYRRRGAGWESVRCPCGRAVQISPALSVSRVRCKSCRRAIEVVPA
jgi:hypothetical protein